jgi:hypothetical protein
MLTLEVNLAQVQTSKSKTIPASKANSTTTKTLAAELKAVQYTNRSLHGAEETRLGTNRMALYL